MLASSPIHGWKQWQNVKIFKEGKENADGNLKKSEDEKINISKYRKC
jgi:hypothetical protein